MTCEQDQAALSDYVDGTLQASEQPSDVAMLDTLEAHLALCEQCRATVEDLHTLREAARTLVRHEPPAEIWTRIAASIDRPSPARVLPFRAAAVLLARRDVLAAAALVLLLAGGSWFAWQRLVPVADQSAIATAVPNTPPDPAPVEDVETQLQLAEEHYTNAIAGLEAITHAESSVLDQETAEVLQTNLGVIDQAIGESREAVRAEPSSDLAQQSLFEALRSKVTLLQGTIALINETRKGNQE